MSWSQQAAFERGSFSTLLGVDCDAIHRAVDVLAIGDCIALLVDGGRFVEAWPFENPDRFRERPTLLATLVPHNTFVSETGFWSASVKTFHLDAYRQPRLYCMTDALGEWALKHAIKGTDGLARLASLATEEDLRSLVVEEREAKRMRVDDSTLIVLSFAATPDDHAISVA